jgi:uncharacterized protein YndB with AHSA1/START domain
MLAQTKTDDFVIARVFDAPRDLLWKCFAERERMNEWFGPKGSVIVASTMDFRCIPSQTSPADSRAIR